MPMKNKESETPETSPKKTPQEKTSEKHNKKKADKEKEDLTPKEIIREFHYYNKNYNFGKIFLGVILIFIGLFFMANNMGWIPVKIELNIWQLWPVAVIFIGLSMLKVHNWFSAMLGTILTLLIIAVLGVMIFGTFDLKSKQTTETPIAIETDLNAKSAVLKIESGMGYLNIKDTPNTSKNIVEGLLQSNFMQTDIDSNMKGDVQTIDLELKGTMHSIFGKKTNNLNLNVNNNIPVKIYIENGASSMNINLNKLMADYLDIDTGASNIDLTLSDKLKNSNIKIDAGASSIDISIPQTVGVKVFLDSGLTSKRLVNFTEIGDNIFKSNNYETSEKKAEIELDLGVSDLNIDWL